MNNVIDQGATAQGRNGATGRREEWRNGTTAQWCNGKKGRMAQRHKGATAQRKEEKNGAMAQRFNGKKVGRVGMEDCLLSLELILNMWNCLVKKSILI
ncbi:MAG: hypothetical protein LLG13_00965 [Bacteroidales bacterium]|nr:hypothetical protein [Bacteroidales bacterium]